MIRAVLLPVVAIAAVFSVTCAAEDIPLSAEEGRPSPGRSEFASLSTEELEKRLDAAKSEMVDLKAENDYLKTEPPDVMINVGMIEETGFAIDGRVRSDLLNPQADARIKGRMKELRHMEREITAELDRRYMAPTAPVKDAQ
ncbi:MAG: hypothetical protein WC515_02820 [Candidatus Omnitrophota bacterium]